MTAMILKMEQSTFDKIYEVVKQIPYGQVATYGQVAALAGNKRWARVVGYALHANPDPDHIPCYRVVNKEGSPDQDREIHLRPVLEGELGDSSEVTELDL